MSLDSILNVVIRLTSSGVSRANFGIPLLACQHALSARPLVDSFASLLEAETAGHVAGSPAHKMLTAAFAQSPRPPLVKLGRRALRVQTIRISAVDTLPANGVVFKGEIDGEEWTYTVSGSATLSAQMTAIASAINALSVAVTATAAATYVDVASASGATHTYETTALVGVQNMIDQSGDTNVNTDLSAFEAFDPDFYGVCIDTASEADITDLAAWTETRSKIWSARTHDFGVALAATTTDIASDLVAAAYARGHLTFTRKVGNLIDVGLLCQRMTANPGSDTWAYKTVAGATVDALSTSEILALEGKNCNYYVRLKGVNLTFWGLTPSGEYIDIARGIDWLVARMQERCLAVLVANEKVDYDDGGIELFAAELRAQLDEAASPTVRFLKTDPAPVVTAPLDADIPTADKEVRTLRNLNFVAYIRGAIHKINPINGTLSF
jgi:hypothetical protein